MVYKYWSGIIIGKGDVFIIMFFVFEEVVIGFDR